MKHKRIVTIKVFGLPVVVAISLMIILSLTLKLTNGKLMLKHFLKNIKNMQLKLMKFLIVLSTMVVVVDVFKEENKNESKNW